MNEEGRVEEVLLLSLHGAGTTVLIHQHLLWKAFASRGLGVGAANYVDSFIVPCDLGPANPAGVSVFPTSARVFDMAVKVKLKPNVALSCILNFVIFIFKRNYDSMIPWLERHVQPMKPDEVYHQMHCLSARQALGG